ncbi:MAG: carboxypeptidase regulatory-like domain-containing protein [Blastocatellia bacterium]|nr:carboxypeptidase regulatory-like domain-containing protein [Blastocatellia bacterium]
MLRFVLFFLMLLLPVTSVAAQSGQKTDTANQNFELLLNGPGRICRSGDFSLQVKAIDPLAFQGVAGVHLEASIFQRNVWDKKLLSVTAVTGEDGLAELLFHLEEAGDYDNSVLVEGSLAGVKASASFPLGFSPAVQVTMQADKPRYKPGQTAHLRWCLRDCRKEVLASVPMLIRIHLFNGYSLESEPVFETEAVPSEFGVAAVDWNIKPDLPLGEYAVTIRPKRLEEVQEYQDFQWPRLTITQYELPEFTVTAKTDRNFYLAPETPAVTVKARTLNGQPIVGGNVRIEQVPGPGGIRLWSATDPAPTGKTDETGTLTANLDPAPDLVEYELASDRYREVEFVAQVTDPATSQTERSRFTVRFSREPIHVYVVRDEVHYRDTVENQPVRFFVATFFPDGKPAACTVTVAQQFESMWGDRDTGYLEILPTLTVQTNQYGVGRLTIPPHTLTPHWNGIELHLTAQTSDGKSGHTLTRVNLRHQEETFELDTDKTLYRAGEPVTVTIRSSEPVPTVEVDMVQNTAEIKRYQVRLNQGKGTMQISGTDKLAGEIMLTAHAFHGPGSIQATRFILFPKPPNLRVSVAVDQPAYHPQESAKASIQVVDIQGKPVAGVVGMAVTNRAVREFVPVQPGGQWRFMGGVSACTMRLENPGVLDALGGIAREDLERLDTSQPISDDLQLVAEILFKFRDTSGQTQGRWTRGPDTPGVQAYFSRKWDPMKALYDLQKNLVESFSQLKAIPQTQAEMEQTGILQTLKDGWGQSLRAEFLKLPRRTVVQVISAGPDRQVGTDDDTVVYATAINPFFPIGRKFEKVFDQFHNQQGERLFVTLDQFKLGLQKEGVDFDRLRDFWGTPFRLEYTIHAKEQYLFLSVFSAGPDRRFNQPDQPSPDDFLVWSEGATYVHQFNDPIRKILTAYRTRHGVLPGSTLEWEQAARESQVNPATLVDRWGNPLTLGFAIKPGPSIKVAVTKAANIQPDVRGTELSVATVTISIHSNGPDGLDGTADDGVTGTVDGYCRMQLNPENGASSSSTGNISGIVTDALGKPLKNAFIQVEAKLLGVRLRGQTGPDGTFVISGLLPGLYQVTANHETGGYCQFGRVPVVAGITTQTDCHLQVIRGSGSTDLVEVSADASLGKLVRPLPQITQLGTPLIRSYEEETTFWLAEQATASNGTLDIPFTTGTSLTAWDVTVLATTKDGRLAFGTTGFSTSQPFSIETRLPSRLTVGDEITVPLLVRNGMGTEQVVALQVQTSPELAVRLSLPSVPVAPGTSQSAWLILTAEKPLARASVRITAQGTEVSDTVETTLELVADRLRSKQTASRYFSDTTGFAVTRPAGADGREPETVLTLYPDARLFSLQGIEHLVSYLLRDPPTGPSSLAETQANLAVLQAQALFPVLPPEAVAKATENLRASVRNLLTFRQESGGFAPYNPKETELEFTIAALEVLDQAQDFVHFEPSLLKTTEKWIGFKHLTDTIYEVHIDVGEFSRDMAGFLTRMRQPPRTIIRRVLDTMPPDLLKFDNPIEWITTTMLARTDGRVALADTALRLLQKNLQVDEQILYWKINPYRSQRDPSWLEETLFQTCRVLRLFLADPQYHPLVAKGLRYVLPRLEQYGGGYDYPEGGKMLLEFLRLAKHLPRVTTGAQTAEIRVNGKPVQTLTFAGTKPISVDLAKWLTAPVNQVEIHRTGGLIPSAFTVTSPQYLSWANPELKGWNQRVKDRNLWLQAGFDKTRAAVGESITCGVEIGSSYNLNYLARNGFLTVEIGLPPGAVVNQTSLERSLRSTGWTLKSLAVQSGKVVLEGFVQFERIQVSFEFVVAHPIKAKATPTLLYQTDKPETKAILPPVEFEIN